MSGNVYRFLFFFHYHKIDCSTALYCKYISNKKGSKVSLCIPLLKTPDQAWSRGDGEERREKGEGEGGCDDLHDFLVR